MHISSVKWKNPNQPNEIEITGCKQLCQSAHMYEIKLQCNCGPWLTWYGDVRDI